MGRPRCPGTSKQTGEGCKLTAGHGTDHSGAGLCKYHGGSSPGGRTQGRRQQAAEAVRAYGLPREVDPHDALVEELWRTAGHIAVMDAQLVDSDLDQEQREILDGIYARERRHYADVAKTCVAIGIEHRRVELEEEKGALIARILRGVAIDLGVADHPDFGASVRRHLATVTSIDEHRDAA